MNYLAIVIAVVLGQSMSYLVVVVDAVLIQSLSNLVAYWSDFESPWFNTNTYCDYVIVLNSYFHIFSM